MVQFLKNEIKEINQKKIKSTAVNQLYTNVTVCQLVATSIIFIKRNRQ